MGSVHSMLLNNFKLNYNETKSVVIRAMGRLPGTNKLCTCVCMFNINLNVKNGWKKKKMDVNPLKTTRTFQLAIMLARKPPE